MDPCQQRPLSSVALTATLQEVFLLIGRGLSNKEIARVRGVSEQAVKHQVSILLRRFGVESRWALIRIATTEEARQIASQGELRETPPPGDEGDDHRPYS